MTSFSIFNFTFNKASEVSCDVFIDGIIVDEDTRQMYADWFNDTTSVSYKSIRTELANCVSEGVKVINIYVNSQGGNVIEAMAMHDYLIELESKGITVNRFTRGMACSAATYIAFGKGSQITENSWTMIHNVSGGIFGNVNEIESYAKTLRTFNDKIVQLYANLSSLEATVIGNMMDDETWMDAETSVKLGFVSKKIPAQNFTNVIDPSKWMFKNTEVVTAYNSFTNINSNEMEKTTIQNIINGVKDAFMDSLKEAGLVKDADTKRCETLNTALSNALSPLNDGIQNMIDEKLEEAITKKMTEIENGFMNKVTEATKELIGNTALEEALKPINTAIETLENSLLDGASSAQGTEKPEAPKTAANHSDIKFE